MSQDVQMKKRRKTGDGDKSDYIHRIPGGLRGRLGKSGCWSVDPADLPLFPGVDLAMASVMY
jgi:hypothetical protein